MIAPTLFLFECLTRCFRLSTFLCTSLLTSQPCQLFKLPKPLKLARVARARVGSRVQPINMIALNEAREPFQTPYVHRMQGARVMISVETTTGVGFKYFDGAHKKLPNSYEPT